MTGERTGRAVELLVSGVLAALAFAVFHPALDGGFVNWDDDHILVQNERFRGLTGEHLRWMATSFHGGHWEPLAWLSFAIDHARAGMEPRAYHQTAVLLHALSTALVFVLTRTLFPRVGVLGAAAAGALFAVHPLRVESVAWATERRDVLSAALFLAAACLWARHATRGARWALMASYGVFAVALTAKASGLAYPLIFLALDRWHLGRVDGARGIGWRRAALEKLPYLALAAAAAIPAVFALREAGATEMGGALSAGQRAAQVAYGLGFYIERTLAPTGLSPLYLLDLDLAPWSAAYVARGLGFAAVCAAAFALRRRAPGIALALVAYVLLIAPFLGVKSNGIHLVADRYAYVACLPFAILVGAWVGRGAAPLRLGVGVVAVVACAWASRAQIDVWHDSRALWDRAVAVQPDNYVARLMRADVRAAAGDADGAVEDLTAAVEARDRYQPAFVRRGMLTARADPAGAMADFDRAIELRPRDPLALGQRGALRLAAGDAEGAVLDLTRALGEKAGDPWLLLNRGAALRQLGRPGEAARDLRAALEVAGPSWPYRAVAEQELRAADATPPGMR